MGIGICCYATRTGLGSMASDIARADWLTDWLVPYHRQYEEDHSLIPAGVRIHLLSQGPETFLESIDGLLIIEQPFDEGLVEKAKARNVPVVFIPMMDWFMIEQAEWLSAVDVVFAPTQHAYREMAAHAANFGFDLMGGRWGVDLERFPFRQRRTVDRFLFSNGMGGAMGRKGAATIAKAAALAPKCDIICCSQTPSLPAMPRNVIVQVNDRTSRSSVYDVGDVFIAPTKWEGIGLQLYECQAAGMPLICTTGEPMDEAQPLWRFASRATKMPGMHYTRYDPDARDLAHMMRELNGRDIEALSAQTRDNMEQHFNLKDTLELLGTAF